MIYTVTLNPTIDRTIHFPALKIGELNRATDSRTDLSGKGINVSVTLGRFGVETVITGFIAGVYGQVLLEGLRSQGYTCDFTEVAGETRSNITVIDQATGVTTKLNEPGPTVTEDDLCAFEERLVGHIQKGDLCVLSGALPPGAPVDTYAHLVRAIQAKGGWAALDTSGPALAEGCRARPDFIKPNFDEALSLTQNRMDTPVALVKGLESILAMGPRRVLLSLGARGAAVASDDYVWLARPPQIKEVSAVGAGDALMAGALWAWEQNLPTEEILRWATAAGTATATEDGTAIPSWERIKQVYEQVQVTRLK
ncbi:MAG: 1-phosphofructokinase [Chloroflexi bacterium]|jgi:1-phosphofructokinase|nr:1-phosphofructokinase [Chloroflexota bacterium]